jgi:hypothetical protein
MHRGSRQGRLRELRLGVLVAIAIAWIACLPAVANAAGPTYSDIHLDLRPEPGADVPTHLCVVSEARGPVARQRLFEVLQRAEGTGRLLVDPKVWDGDEKSTEQQRCGEDPINDCRPQLELPSKLADTGELFVACTADLSAEGGTAVEPRPLFVLIEYLNASPPQVESVRLGGGVATVGVFGASLKGVDVTARALGGHYTPDTRSARAVVSNGEGRESTAAVKLELSPRCRQVEVKLPRFKVKPADRESMTVRVHGKAIDVHKCVGNVVGSNVIQVRVPPAPLGVGSIDVEIARAGGGTARFGQDYEQRWPSTPFVLEFEQVSFTWRRPQCIYPANECPIARLEGGTTCAGEVIPPAGPGERSPGCSYRCPGEYSEETAVDITLPAEVEFEKSGPTQTWSDTLAKNGEDLTSYVSSDEVYLGGSINDWRTSVPDNSISAVEIYGEDGTIRKYSVAHVDRLVLKVPSATIQAQNRTCEGVRFRPVGDRSYDELVGSVSDGAIEFGDPERGARILNFTVMLAAGGGPAWVPNVATPPLYFTGLGMFGIELRPRKGPLANRFAGEFRVGMTLGTWGVTTREEPETEPEPTDPMRIPPAGTQEEDTSDEDTVDEETRIGWARVLFEPGMSVSVHERVALGVGVGLGFSLPFRRRDVELTGAELNFIYSPVLDFRFRLRRWLRLVFQFRYMGGERAFKISEENRSDTTAEAPTRERPRAESFIVLAGLQFKF